MPSPCSSLWLFLFLRNLIVDTPAAAEMIPNATTPSCPSYRCGHAVDIRYPFWIDDNTSAAGSYCGYPSLRLECRRDTPVLPLPSGEYAVTHILYSDRTVSLFDVGVFSRSNTCPLVGRNLSLPAGAPLSLGSPLSLTARDTNLTFFVHCSFMGMPAHLVACLEGDGRHHSYVFRDGDDRTPYGYAGLCQDVVSMPVLRRSLLGGNNSLLDAVVVPALNMGFELSWRPPREDGECGDCEKAGGWCGHRRRAAHEPWTFTCFRTATTATRAGTKSPTPDHTAAAACILFLLLHHLPCSASPSWCYSLSQQPPLMPATRPHRRSASRRSAGTSPSATRSGSPASIRRSAATEPFRSRATMASLPSRTGSGRTKSSTSSTTTARSWSPTRSCRKVDATSRAL
uniref:Wall-associated receptor kinase galacturonan-binding domain-containing protein n=1 Tax=Oryza brachyantha TaxID=4533 RepID=J3KW75_ORYBR